MNKQVLIDDTIQFASQFALEDNLRGKSILITGASGLIGSVMTKCLIELNRHKKLGIRILAVVRDANKTKDVFAGYEGEFVVIESDLLHLTQNKIGDQVNYIMHLAGPTASSFFVEKPVETIRSIFEGTSAMLEYVKKNDVTSFVFASSLEVYGINLTDEWLTEDFQGYVNLTKVRSSYNIGKRAAESLCCAYANEYKLPVKIARLTQTFGAGVQYDDQRVFAQFARSVIHKRDISLNTVGDTKRMYIYTTDAVSAMLYILLKGVNGEVYNVANKDTYISIYDMAKFVQQSFNNNAEVIISRGGGHEYAPSTKLRLDTTKLELLGWRPHYGIDEMYDKLISYMR